MGPFKKTDELFQLYIKLIFFTIKQMCQKMT